MGVAATQSFFTLAGMPITDAGGTLLGLAISGGQAGPQSMVSILDAGAIRKSFADWQHASPPPAGVQLTAPEVVATETQRTQREEK